MAKGGEVTRLLAELEAADAEDRNRALASLVSVLYRELKLLARSNRYRWQGRDASPGTTSLVHEVYAKLALGSGVGYESRRQFFCVASRAMRSILIDNARCHLRQKRGGGKKAAPLDEARLVSAERAEQLLALDTALGDLEEHEPELARIVDCRIFGGLTVDETAEAVGISPATVKRRWSLAKAWLYRELASGDPASQIR